MENGESSNNFANDTSGMRGDTNLSKKSFDELSKIVVGLVKTNKKQQLKIQELEKKQQEMNDRLRVQEHYTSKDCVIICNPPFDSIDQLYLPIKTLFFLMNILESNCRRTE